MRIGVTLGLFCAFLASFGGAAMADSPKLPRKPPVAPFDCSGLSHADEVADLIRKQTSCRAATRIYFACEDRWTNFPDSEEAAVNACDNEVPGLTPKQQERYENQREACILRFQARDMRIFWSAVRVCRVKLAAEYARRYGK